MLGKQRIGCRKKDRLQFLVIGSIAYNSAWLTDSSRKSRIGSISVNQNRHNCIQRTSFGIISKDLARNTIRHAFLGKIGFYIIWSSWDTKHLFRHYLAESSRLSSFVCNPTLAADICVFTREIGIFFTILGKTLLNQGNSRLKPAKLGGIGWNTQESAAIQRNPQDLLVVHKTQHFNEKAAISRKTRLFGQKPSSGHESTKNNENTSIAWNRPECVEFSSKRNKSAQSCATGRKARNLLKKLLSHVRV